MRKLPQLISCVLLAAGTTAACAQDDAALLARGKYLMEGVVACANCHIARSDKSEPLYDKGLSGGMLFDDPAFKAYAPNITPDPETGIGKWTDAQLAKAIREGIRPDGSLIGPPMPIPFYRNLSDADLFRETVRRGRRQGSTSLVAHAIVLDRPQPARVGFIVSKAVGTAVVRNRVKRRLREVARDSLTELPGSAVLVVRALPAAAEASFAELRADFGRCLHQVLP